MNRLSAEEILWFHERLIEDFGGKAGVLNIEGVRSAAEGIFQTFDGEDLYPTLLAKAGTLCFLLVKGHYFLDGNKRTGFASMAALLERNGHRIIAPWQEAERALVGLAAGEITREAWMEWVASKVFRV